MKDLFSGLLLIYVKTPDCTIIPLGAEKIGEQLVNLRQWSELSKGFDSVQDLLDACVLGADGKVGCPARVTELTAETWVQAAQIYLYCRFFRYVSLSPALLRRTRTDTGSRSRRDNAIVTQTGTDAQQETPIRSSGTGKARLPASMRRAHALQRAALHFAVTILLHIPRRARVLPRGRPPSGP
jgi:hypothetical protein